MIATCANRTCSTHRVHHEGKLFRLDLDIGSTAGRDQRKTAYVWLCEQCAEQLRPRLEVTATSVRVRLRAIYHTPGRESRFSQMRVN